MNNLKEINFKNCGCYYFDGIIKVEDFDFDMKYHMKIFWFVTFHTNLWLLQNHCVLALIKEAHLLEFMMELGG